MGRSVFQVCLGFPTEEDALAEAIAAIKMEGISAFVGDEDEEDEQEDRPLVH